MKKGKITLIGLSGKIKSGKDTVAEMIQDIMPDEWVVKKFAGKLKEIVSLLTGISVEDLEKQDIKEKPLGEEWRRYFIKHGPDSKICNGYFANLPIPVYYTTKEEAEWAANHQSEGNEKEEKYFADSEILTSRKILQLMGTECGRNILHPNIWVNALFADYEKYFEGWIVTDVRFPNEAEEIKKRGGIVIRINRAGHENTGDHPSETSLDYYGRFNHVIENNGSLEDLYSKIEYLMQPIIYSRTI